MLRPHLYRAMRNLVAVGRPGHGALRTQQRWDTQRTCEQI